MENCAAWSTFAMIVKSYSLVGLVVEALGCFVVEKKLEAVELDTQG